MSISKIEERIDQWYVDIRELEKEISLAKKNRNYYEGTRRRLQKKLDVLIANDPRQTKLEIEE